MEQGGSFVRNVEETVRFHAIGVAGLVCAPDVRMDIGEVASHVQSATKLENVIAVSHLEVVSGVVMFATDGGI